MIADWDNTFAIEIKSSISPEPKLSANTKKYLPHHKTGGAFFFTFSLFKLIL